MPTPHLAHGRRRGLIELVNENKVRSDGRLIFRHYLVSSSRPVYITVWECVRVLGEVIMLI